MSNLPEFTQLSLLLKVIPGFHGVCDFYMSDHNAAVEVQQRLGKGNRFFENLSLRLSSLYQTFTALSPDNETWSARSVRSALNDLLDAFRHCLTLNANICFKVRFQIRRSSSQVYRNVNKLIVTTSDEVQCSIPSAGQQRVRAGCILPPSTVHRKAGESGCEAALLDRSKFPSQL